MLEIGILSYPAPARIGQAYLTTLADIIIQFTDPDEYQGKRHSVGRKYISSLIRNMYTPAKDLPEYDVPQSLYKAVMKSGDDNTAYEFHTVLQDMIEHIVFLARHIDTLERSLRH